MKTDGVRHITDKSKLHYIFNEYFINHNVMMKVPGVNISVKVVKFENDRIHISLTDPQLRNQASAIYSRHDDQIYYSHIIHHGIEGELVIFEPEGVLVYNASRKEERKRINGNAQKALISGIISTSVIEESFRNNKSRVEWIRSEISAKLEERFENIRVFFLNDKKWDSRMNWVLQERKPVFIPVINLKQEGRDSAEYAKYMNDIYYTDPLVKEGGFNSEIIVPLLYLGMIPFGYVQINGPAALSEEALSYAKRMGLAFSESVSKDGLLFRPSEDSMMIVDLSPSGIGILFRERSLIRHFREEGYIMFTVFMPENKQASMLCRVMNINYMADFFRVGCMIESIDPSGDMNYHEFLGKI